MSSLFETGIRPAIDAYLAKKAAEKRNYGKYWSASSAGYCMRLNILKRLDIPPVPEIADDLARTTRVFESGHIFHEFVQRITRDAGLSIAQELELQDEDLLIRGHIDDLILAEQPDHPVKLTDHDFPGEDGEPQVRKHLILYDYKTANSQAFNYKREQIGDYHRMQLGTYMYLLRKQAREAALAKARQTGTRSLLSLKVSSLTEARILQISKDDLRLREQQLFWSPELEHDVVSYWRRLQAHWEKKVLPPCTCLQHDGGFMGKRSKAGKCYNPYFHQETPCADTWIKDKLPERWSV